MSALGCAALLFAVACGGDDEGSGEILINPGFEEGKTGWTSLETEVWFPDFNISTDVVHGGTQAAHLEMRPQATEPTLIFGVVQEVTPEEFPGQVSGFYRVDNWQRATPKQYLQIVVIAWEAENRPPQFNNHQIRYILGGIDQPPFRIDNAKYIFLNTGEPQQGEWLPFTLNVRQDFIDQWGEAPEGFEFIRLLFEVRYDERTSGQNPTADVYYDDLHVGDALEE
jgi:hypothetical protein